MRSAGSRRPAHGRSRAQRAPRRSGRDLGQDALVVALLCRLTTRTQVCRAGARGDFEEGTVAPDLAAQASRLGLVPEARVQFLADVAPNQQGYEGADRGVAERGCP